MIRIFIQTGFAVAAVLSLFSSAHAADRALELSPGKLLRSFENGPAPELPEVEGSWSLLAAARISTEHVSLETFPKNPPSRLTFTNARSEGRWQARLSLASKNEKAPEAAIVSANAQGVSFELAQSPQFMRSSVTHEIQCRLGASRGTPASRRNLACKKTSRSYTEEGRLEVSTEYQLYRRER